LALVDVHERPPWDALETIRRLWQAQPRLEIVLCASCANSYHEEIVGALGRSDRLLILKRPFDRCEVRQLALTLTAKWRLAETVAAREQPLAAAAQTRLARCESPRDCAPSQKAEPYLPAIEQPDPLRLIDGVQSLLWSIDEPAAKTAMESMPSASAVEEVPCESTPPVCWEVLRDRCQGDVAFCRRLLEMFTRRVADQLAGIQCAADAGDADALTRKAHAAKSVAATLAADAICQGAAELERLGRKAEFSAVQSVLPRFREEVGRCLEYIPRLLATLATMDEPREPAPSETEKAFCSTP
jgi:HPt (histidine-containing phosphotransfer) domain-containing protein